MSCFLELLNLCYFFLECVRCFLCFSLGFVGFDVFFWGEWGDSRVVNFLGGFVRGLLRVCCV